MTVTLILAAALAGQYPRVYAQPQAAAYQQPRAYAEKVILQFVPSLTANEYYGGVVGAATRDEQAKAATARQADELDARLEKLTATVEALRQAVSSAPPASNSSTVPPPPPPPAIPQPVDGRAAVTTIFQKNCAACHTAPARAARGIVLLNPDGTLAPIAPATVVRIDHATYDGTMPPGGQLDTETYSTIREWVGQYKESILQALKGK